MAEHMDIPRINALSAYWEQYPPLHVMVAAYLGVGKPKAKPLDEAGIEELMMAFPQNSG